MEGERETDCSSVTGLERKCLLRHGSKENQETKQKQLLVNKVNNQVGEEIKLLLQEEAEFYEQTDKD